MPSNKNRPTGKCPIHFALDTFGDRWSLLVIRDIVFKGKKYYRDFLDSPEKISTNILASRLAKLEADGILSKTVDPANASRFIYGLTTKGNDLIPVLLEMTAWSSKYDEQDNIPSNIIGGAPKHLLRRLQNDRTALVKEIVDNID